MAARSDLRSAAERLRERYGHLLGDVTPRPPAISARRIAEVQRRLSSRRRDPSQLRLDLTGGENDQPDVPDREGSQRPPRSA